MSANIVTFISVSNDPVTLREISDIFFESSTKKTFKDELERESFFQKYLGYYLDNFPELAWVAVGERVLGYVVVAPDSMSEELLELQPHLQAFAPHLKLYPAHLHINCHVSSRGLGIGSALVCKVEETLKNLNIKGLHIMTGVGAPNHSFYKKLGFENEVMENFHGSSILLMGKSL